MMTNRDRQNLAKRQLLGASKRAFQGKENFPQRYFKKLGDEAANRQIKYRNWMPVMTPGDRGINP